MPTMLSRPIARPLNDGYIVDVGETSDGRAMYLAMAFPKPGAVLWEPSFQTAWIFKSKADAEEAIREYESQF